jgi:hypothetical protein
MGAKLALRLLDHRPEEVGGNAYLALLAMAKRCDDEKREFSDSIVFLADLMGVKDRGTARDAIKELITLGQVSRNGKTKSWPSGHGSDTVVYKVLPEKEAVEIPSLKCGENQVVEKEAVEIPPLKWGKTSAEEVEILPHSNPKEDKIEGIEGPKLAELFFDKLHHPSSYRNTWKSWEPELRSLSHDNPDLPDLIKFALVKDNFWSNAGGWLKSKKGPLSFLRNNLDKIRKSYDQWKWDNSPKAARSIPPNHAAPPKAGLMSRDDIVTLQTSNGGLPKAQAYFIQHRSEYEALPNWNELKEEFIFRQIGFVKSSMKEP